jgi:hypothetical protein
LLERYGLAGREAEAMAIATAIAPPHRTTTTTTAPTIRMTDRTARSLAPPERFDSDEPLAVRLVLEGS